MAVERVRAPRTDRGMDAGGWWQKLLRMLPGEGEGGECHRLPGAQGSFWARLWGGLWGAQPGGALRTLPRATRARPLLPGE